MLDVRENKVQGWDAIAAAIGVDIRTARRYAIRKVDPLPVYWRRCGSYVVAHATALRDWVARQDIPLDMRRQR
jgi:hypothetical protein